MSDQFYTLPTGRKIHYRLDKCPHPFDNPPKLIILSNSLTAPFTSWNLIASNFVDLGFDVLRYNQPGHGQSGVEADLGATTFKGLAADVHALLTDGLKLDKVFAWVGVSMGAATGVYFAGLYPGVVQRLVVADTISCSAAAMGTPEKDVFGPRVAAARKDGSMEKTIEGTLERWFGIEWMGDNLTEAERMRNLMNAGVSVDGFETCCAALKDPYFDLRGERAQAAGRGVLRALLVVGEKDANLPETMKGLRDDIQQGINDAEIWGRTVELEVIKGAGHVCYIDKPGHFEKVVSSFLTAK